jgi:hypothetical protein
MRAQKRKFDDFCTISSKFGPCIVCKKSVHYSDDEKTARKLNISYFSNDIDIVCSKKCVKKWRKMVLDGVILVSCAICGEPEKFAEKEEICIKHSLDYYPSDLYVFCSADCVKMWREKQADD